MGLDNGIIVKCDNMEEFFDNCPSFVKTVFGDNEICYWRKCWGLRGEILGVLHSSDYKTKIDKEDIPAILDVIKKYLNPDYWDYNANSIWSWEDYFEHNVQQYINLSYLYDVWDDYPGMTAEFYDSY